MSKITKILLWLVIAILFLYFIFVPFTFTRNKPSETTPLEPISIPGY